MYNSIATEQAEQSTTDISVKDQNNNDSSEDKRKLIKRKDYKGLQLIGIEDGKWFAVMGQKRLTQYFENEKALKNYIDKHMWELVIIIAAAVSEEVIHMKNS